ncbi:hypothetical protein [Hyphomonas sp.]|uniref:hypothetical protein n=1 Tax=Hyphomonas sp. TaxID=87 RepID=UPI00391B00A6
MATEDAARPAYAEPARPRRVKRVKLALFCASMIASVAVSIIGGLTLGLFDLIGGAVGRDLGVTIAQGGPVGGAILAAQLSMLNFILFFLTIPAAAIALGLSIARLPGRGITAGKPYLRWGGIWGGVLVSVTTALFGLFVDVLAGIGAFITGGLIGGLAGLFCGLVFHSIVRPARQLSQEDISVF